MSLTITPKIEGAFSSDLLKGGIERTLREKGRLPPVTMIVTPIEGSRPVIRLDNFLDYNFDSSILIPVDTFNFSFISPDGPPFYNEVREGDIVSLYANDFPLAVGIIDTIEIDTETDGGEKVMINGRDLMAQLEDQDAISVQDKPIWGSNETIQSVFSKLSANTRIQSNGLQLKNPPPVQSGLFATQPGESKLTALQRFLEPLNSLAWMDTTGKLNIGKPNFTQKAKGILKLNKSARDTNVTSMKVIYSSTNIANIIVPIWSGQENVQDRLPGQRVENKAFGPTRLRTAGHRVPKSVVVSTPQGSNPQALADVTFLKQNTNVLNAYAQREIARQNQKERIVQVVVPGHYDESGNPYNVDSVYHIQYERGSVDDDMYLFQVQYSLSEGSGQKTALYFCNKFTIVAGNKQ